MVNTESKKFKPLYKKCEENLSKTAILESKKAKENINTKNPTIRPKKEDLMQFIFNILQTKIIHRGRWKIRVHISNSEYVIFFDYLAFLKTFLCLENFLLMCLASSKQKPENSFCHFLALQAQVCDLGKPNYTQCQTVVQK